MRRGSNALVSRALFAPLREARSFAPESRAVPAALDAMFMRFSEVFVFTYVVKLQHAQAHLKGVGRTVRLHLISSTARASQITTYVKRARDAHQFETLNQVGHALELTAKLTQAQAGELCVCGREQNLPFRSKRAILVDFDLRGVVGSELVAAGILFKAHECRAYVATTPRTRPITSPGTGTPVSFPCGKENEMAPAFFAFFTKSLKLVKVRTRAAFASPVAKSGPR